MTRLILSAALLTFVLIPQLKSQTIVAVPFDELEASQYNIGLNGVAWSQSSTLSNFFKLYTTGWLNGKYDPTKPERYYGPGSEGIFNYASNNAPPSIYGANGFFGIRSDTNANVQHLLDNHHRVSGLYLLTTIFTNGYSTTVTVTNASGAVIATNIGAAPNYTFVNQTADWSAMLPTVFWSNMLAGTRDTNFAPVSTNANGFWGTTNQPTFLWAYNRGELQIPTTTPPPMIPNLSDDTLRDVAAQVNYPGDYGFTNVGYQNRDDAESNNIQGNDGDGKVLYYQEFWWANYLRPYVYLIPTGSNILTAGMDSNAPYQFTDYHQLIAFSADFLCHSTNAANLPGYYDPGLASVDFPQFRPGSTVLIGPSGALNVSGNMIIDNGATLIVKGALTVTNETFYVGKDTANNTMVITNGGVVTNSNSVIGYAAAATNNSVLVTGAGSTWTNSGNLTIGDAGSSNRLVISNGGAVFNAMGYIGSASTAIGNLVTVTGGSSSWINSGDLYVGYAGQSNRLVISNGGFVSNVNGFDDGVDPTDAYNSVLVTGAGSRWSNSGNLTFGLAGHDNSLVISNGGIVTVGVDSKIGDLATASNNSVLVTGPSSIWTNSGTLYVGNYGSGNSLVISNGGSVLNAGSSYISFRGISSNNSVHVTGSGSSLVSQFGLGIGAFGAGNMLTISDGASVSNAYAAIGVGSLASNNSVLVTGSNSTWRSSDSLAIGGGGLYYPSGGSSWNSLTISNGASVYAGRGFIGSLDSSNNSVLVTGAGSLWSISTNLVVGYSNSSHNSLVISNGGRVNSSVADIGFAATSTGNSVLITGTGSAWSNSGNLTIGDAGSGTLTVANGGVLSASRILIGTNGDLDFGRYQQNDTAGNVVTTAIEFTGTNSDDYGINFNQSDTLHLTSSIIGAGWVCQLGTGTSVMSGSNSYSLYTKIDAGTLVAASTNALGTGYLGIGGYADRATLKLATNLTVGDFTWGSNGVVALTAGSQILTVAAMTNAGATGSFQFLDLTLNNNTNILINFTSQSGFTTNSFSLSGIAGYSFGLTSTNLTAFISTNANLVVSDSVTVSDTLTVSSLTIDSTGILKGTGTLFLTGGNLNLNGTFAPGNSPGTFFVTGGNLVMGSTATWDQQIFSSSLYDRVVVTGAAFLNGTMNITTFGSGGLEYGQKFNFLTASAGISGAFSSILAPEGFRGRLLLSGNNTEANILIAPASYTQLAQNPNQVQVATALNSFIPATSGDRLVISTSLDSLTADQYAQAFNAIMPTMYQSMATIAFNQANALNMQLNQRLWGLRIAEGGGFSMSGFGDNTPMLEGQGDGAGKGVLDSKKDILRPGADNHWGMFVDANGIFANANSGNMLPGYSAQSGGINAGLTYKWNDSFASGLYCGYQGTYAKMGANGSGLGTGSSLIDNAVRFGVFGTYGHKDGKGFYGNALAGGAYHNYQVTRVIQYAGMNRTANSAPGAGELDTMLATGYDIQKGNFTFGPTASLQYTYLGVNPVNETGAQSLNFNSGGWNSSSMLSSVGAHAAYNWQAGKNVVVVPQLSLSWQHEFLQNPYNITGTLGGTSPTFSNTSATGIRDYLYTGVGFTVEIGKRWNSSFFYNAAAGNSDLVSQNIFWSAGVKF
jgi:T5SS/PEP-CTERM-associated repeat protein